MSTQPPGHLALIVQCLGGLLASRLGRSSTIEQLRLMSCLLWK